MDCKSRRDFFCVNSMILHLKRNSCKEATVSGCKLSGYCTAFKQQCYRDLATYKVLVGHPVRYTVAVVCVCVCVRACVSVCVCVCVSVCV